MPSKALLRPGAVVSAARRVRGAAAAVTGGLDVPEVLARRDAFASDWDDSGQAQWLDDAGITLIRGFGRFLGPRRIRVSGDSGDVVVEARHAVIVATGSDAMVPPVPGLVESGVWTNREATAFDSVPDSLAIIGGGVVACEMATAFSDLGSRVTVLVRGEGLLSSAEPFAGEAVARSLRDLGVEVRFGVEAQRVERADDGVRLELSDGSVLHVAEVLAATGRVPATGDLDIGVLGLEPGAPLRVSDALEVEGVAGGWLFAVGDVTDRSATTHQGKYEARVAGDVVAARFGSGGDVEASAGAWSRLRASADHGGVAQVIFSRPEVAMVGLTEEAARGAGRDVRVVEVPLTSVSAAKLLADSYEGTAKVVLDADRGVVLGATFVGQDVAELVHAATIALVGEVPLDRLWHAVPAFPTLSEVWLRLLEAADL